MPKKGIFFIKRNLSLQQLVGLSFLPSGSFLTIFFKIDMPAQISMFKGDYETSGTKMPKNDATITRKKDDEVSAT